MAEIRQALVSSREGKKRIHALEQDVSLLYEDKKTCLRLLEKDPHDLTDFDEMNNILRRGSLVATSEAMWREDKLRTRILRLEDRIHNLETDHSRAKKHHLRNLDYEVRRLTDENNELRMGNNDFNDTIVFHTRFSWLNEQTQLVREA